MFDINPDVRSAQQSCAFRRMFAPRQLTFGVFFPIEAFSGDRPSMTDQIALAQRAEELGFAALWFRDVPLRDPSFGDVGQVFDPFVYLAYIAAHTRRIALATGAIVLPVRHPLHTAKAAASVDQLSGGRLLLGVASGDRPVEFPAFGVDAEQRGDAFRENLRVLRLVLEESFPAVSSSYGSFTGADLVPKPVRRIPMLVTGSSRQSHEWIAQHSDGWITYPRPATHQARLAREWHDMVEQHAPGAFKPFAQSLYVDLSEDSDEGPTPIHLGFRAGWKALVDFALDLRAASVNHVAFNLKYGRRDAREIIEEIGREVLPRVA
ncbi:MAG TPA: LLM class oxidoreductase [Gemmatimonadaceae bacterium]|nr:LLM class oxidoreductase [Gemmatimonadaceae bacterium]